VVQRAQAGKKMQESTWPRRENKLVSGVGIKPKGKEDERTFNPVERGQKKKKRGKGGNNSNRGGGFGGQSGKNERRVRRRERGFDFSTSGVLLKNQGREVLCKKCKGVFSKNGQGSSSCQGEITGP